MFVYVHHTEAGAYGGPNWVSDPLELEKQVVVSCQ